MTLRPMPPGLLSHPIVIHESRLSVIPQISAWSLTGTVVLSFPRHRLSNFSLRTTFSRRIASLKKFRPFLRILPFLWSFPLRPSSAPTGAFSSDDTLSAIQPFMTVAAWPVALSSRKTSMENPPTFSSGGISLHKQAALSVRTSSILSTGNFGFACHHWAKSPMSKMNSCPSGLPRPLSLDRLTGLAFATMTKHSYANSESQAFFPSLPLRQQFIAQRNSSVRASAIFGCAITSDLPRPSLHRHP